jgi:hypothetical protein
LDEDDPAHEQRIEQQERFAVGMIGFALEQDFEFRVHFLERVCGLKDLSRASGWEILVEPENWGDLVLKHRPSDSFVVAEFKIGAPLEGHQNPSDPIFYLPSRNGQAAGYGWEITQIAAREKWAHSKYLTVEKKASWSKVLKENYNLNCVPAEWQEFLRTDISQESELETEVYDCLSHFGVSIFTSRRMKEMKLANQATRPLALLMGVLDNFKPGFKKRLLDAGEDYFGVNIRKEDFPQTARLVELEPERDIAGWFGYESGDPFGPRLAVWFYCGNSDGIKPAARDHIKKLLRNVGFEERAFREHDNCLHLFCKAEESGGDAEWFTKVLTALN